MKLSRTTTIADLCELYGLTPRAVRYYEELGLIEVGRTSLNHRTFDSVAREQLGLIAVLRRADVGLKDIREVLQARNEGRERQDALAAAKLERRVKDLDAKVRHIRETLALVQSRPGLRQAR